jgi:hypothetical protein
MEGKKNIMEVGRQEKGYKETERTGRQEICI